MEKTNKTSLGLEENVAGLLSYVLGWLTGLIFLLAEKKSKFVRFHALQSIMTFLPLSVLAWLLGWIGAPKVTYDGYYGYSVPTVNPGIPALIYLSWIIWAISFVLWIVLMIKAYQGEKFKLPVVGDIAEKHA
ncbi:MAG: DUF4870 domain-containing protein [Thermoplasmata archaeon]|nr:MAG: DUF4870 domain-containing protein [Thermoplasmata archaeon]KAA0015146.1 MAG: DUF4870 domain-containing protein [Thermoplasmata archaeon]